MNFAERIAEQAAKHHDENIRRLRKQAANRAESNGFDGAMAADAAEHMYPTGESFESILTTIAGPYQRRAA